MNGLRTRWAQRTARERTLLMLLAAVLAALILWLCAWQPLTRALALEEQRQTRLMLLSRQMASLPERVSEAGLESLLRQRAVAQGIDLTSLTRSKNQFEITVSNASGDALLAWLLTLEAQGVVQVLALNVQGKSPPDGSVSARLRLAVR